MKHFLIKDTLDNVISQNLALECDECYGKCFSIGKLINDCPKYGGNRRQGIITNGKGITFLCCDTTKTTKLFRDKLEALSYAYYDLLIPKKQIEEEIKNAEQQKINRLVHNLISINAHNIHEIYDLIPQETLSENWRSQLEYIQNEIGQNTRKAALMFLRIAKHNIHMKSEFSIYRKLDRTDNISLEIKSWSIRKVLLNVLHTFFADFTNNKIYIQVSEYFGKVKFDYETIQVALYHLIENSSKYARPNSTINISFIESVETLTLSIEMISLFIQPNEREKIFSEGFSGSLAKSLAKSGDGIGMWRIKQMIELNKGIFTVECGEKTEQFKGINYCNNTFKLVFKRF